MHLKFLFTLIEETNWEAIYSAISSQFRNICWKVARFMEKKLRKTKGCVIMSVTYSMSQLSKAENWKNKTKSKTFHFFDEEFYRTNIPKIESQKHFWKRIILNKTMAEESTEEVRKNFAILCRLNQSFQIFFYLYI